MATEPTTIAPPTRVGVVTGSARISQPRSTATSGLTYTTTTNRSRGNRSRGWSHEPNAHDRPASRTTAIVHAGKEPSRPFAATSTATPPNPTVTPPRVRAAGCSPESTR
jgi:hypothetical protein